MDARLHGGLDLAIWQLFCHTSDLSLSCSEWLTASLQARKRAKAALQGRVPPQCYIEHAMHAGVVLLGSWGLDVYMMHANDAHRVASVSFKHEESPQPVLLGEGVP